MSKLVSKKTFVLYFLFSLLILLSLATYFKKKTTLVKESGNENEIEETISVETNSDEIKEEIKDGVYTNYEYGFKFIYDDNKFLYEEDENFIFSYDRNAVLTVTVLNPSEKESKYFSVFSNLLKKCQNSIDNSVIEGESLYTKIYQSKLGCAVAYDTASGQEGEKKWAYLAIYPLDKNFVLIELLDWKSDQDLFQYKESYEKLFNSFEII